jgi:hypothetical protein
MIMAYELDDNHYFAKVTDPRTYGEISHDILSRYVHPLVLDSSLLCPSDNYEF